MLIVTVLAKLGNKKFTLKFTILVNIISTRVTTSVSTNHRDVIRFRVFGTKC